MSKASILRFIRNKARDAARESTRFAEMLDEIADEIDDMPEEAARREKTYTPIHKGSPIAYETWRCSYCGFEDRFKKGAFCKMCGRRFDE